MFVRLKGQMSKRQRYVVGDDQNANTAQNGTKRGNEMNKLEMGTKLNPSLTFFDRSNSCL